MTGAGTQRLRNGSRRRRTARVLLAGLLLSPVAAAPIAVQAQIDLEASLIAVFGGVDMGPFGTVVVLHDTVVVMFSVEHVAGGQSDDFNTVAGPPVGSNVLLKLAFSSNSDNVSCSLGGCTGRITPGEHVTFLVTIVGANLGTTTFSINTSPNFRSDINPSNNRVDVTIHVEESAPDPPGSISGEVFGLFGLQEVPLAGVRVNLYRVVDAVGEFLHATTTTSVASGIDDMGEVGFYSFEDVPAGRYVVRQEAPDGFVQSIPAPGLGRKVTLDAGERRDGVDFYNAPVPMGGAVAGHVFVDVDESGTLSATNFGLGGQLVCQDQNGNGRCDPDEPAVRTGFNGAYALPLEGGELKIAFELQLGWRLTTQIVPSVNLGDSDVNIGIHPLRGAIFGAKWADLNGDGQRGFGEPVLGGWKVYIDLNDNGALDDGEPETVTESASGTYAFADLASGTYVVRLDDRAGYAQTVPLQTTGAPFYTLSVSENELVRNVDFASEPVTRSISGIKWEDLNGDGIRQETEPVLGGWTIYLDLNRNAYPDGGDLVATTDPATGAYLFDHLEPDEYHVREVEAFFDGDFFEQTFPLNSSRRNFHEVVVGEFSPVVRDVNFGNVRGDEYFTVSGVKFADLDGDGEQAEREPGLDGWTIRVSGRAIGRNGIVEVFEQMTTQPLDLDGDGQTVRGAYRFRLPEGGYFIYEDENEGFVVTSPKQMGPFRGGEIGLHLVKGHHVYLDRNVEGLDFANQPVVPLRVSGYEELVQAIHGCNAAPEDEMPCRVQLEDFSGKNTLVLRPFEPLPSVTRPIVIAGAGAVLDGSDAGAGANGLHFLAGRSEVSDLTISDFDAHAILLDGAGENRIYGNRFISNGGNGVRIASGERDVMMGNVFIGNAGTPIQFDGGSPAPPHLGRVEVSDSTRVIGTIHGGPSASYVVEFFASASCDASGRGAGEVFLGLVSLATGFDGAGSFEASLGTTLHSSHFVTATLTGPEGTSPFSECVVGVGRFAEDVPAAFALHPNYPNPFNPSTTIRFDLDVSAHVQLLVYNVVGQVVARLLDEPRIPGAYYASFDARGLASGVYFYRLEAGNRSVSRPMILVR